MPLEIVHRAAPCRNVPVTFTLELMFRVLPALLVVACCTAGADTLCGAGEQVAFSCRIGKSRKIVSLCASPALTRDTGSLTYRFGLPGRVELQFPRGHAEGAARQFRYAHYFRAQIDRTEVSFFLGSVKYTIFSYYEAGEAPPMLEGVRVSQPGRNTEFVCSGSAVVDFSMLEQSLLCDGENALGSCK